MKHTKAWGAFLGLLFVLSMVSIVISRTVYR